MKPKILIVDDREENLLALDSLLSELDAEVIQASSGQEALSRALEGHYALILMDVQMPGMDGFETAELLRGVKHTRHVPIIFVTAISKEQKYVFRGYEAGAVDYLFKPLEPDVVLAKVRIFLELYRQRQKIEEQALELRQAVRDAEAARDVARARTQDLQAQNEALEQFARVAAHDLKAPLRSVVSFSKLLEREVGTELTAKAQKYLDYMVSAGTRMSNLIGDLLEYSRVGHDEDDPPKVIDLNEVVTAVIGDLTADLSECSGEVVAGDLPAVNGHPLLIRLLIQNMINNAVKYRGDAPPRVEVTGSESGSVVTVRVKDNGIGIEPKYLAQIFEPFKRLHGHGKFTGTGIGLATCVKIVTSHGGTITAESEGEGMGCTFIVTLPAAPAGGAA